MSIYVVWTGKAVRNDEWSAQPVSPRLVLAHQIRSLIKQEQLNPGEFLGSERGWPNDSASRFRYTVTNLMASNI